LGIKNNNESIKGIIKKNLLIENVNSL